MMAKYRISKYLPKYRNEKGEYKKNDWTSYADIGKEYDTEQLTLQKYLGIEKCYCDIVEAIVFDNEISALTVEELECNFTADESKKLLGSKGIALSEMDVKFINNLENGYVIFHSDLKQIISLILRDCFWCKLIAENKKFVIEFGYDLYVYITCDTVSSQTFQLTGVLGMYIETMQ